MALEVTNILPEKDYSDAEIDSAEKSIIKINSTSYNVFKNWFDLIQKYFGIDDSNNPFISTLKSSFFGYFNELASNEIKNAVYHKNFLYDEHFLNTAVLPESIYNFAKINNVTIDTATPATMYLKMSVLESSLVSSTFLKEISLDAITNANTNTLKVFTLTFDRDNTTFTVGGKYNFSLPYPIILTIQQIKNEDEGYSYSYSAVYDTTRESFPISEKLGKLPFLKVWKENVNGVDFIYIGFQVFQFERKINEVTITTSATNPDTLYHTFLFDNQLSFFDAKYEYNGKITNLNLYFNNIYTPTEEEYYGYYTYLNDNCIQLSFSANLGEKGFRPAPGSTIYFTTYTTLGNEGNFDYSGSVSMKFSDKLSYGYLDFNCETMIDGSSGGKDRLDTYGQKIKILEQVTTRNNIITENDLIKFFDSANESLNINGSTIQFLKKQDDVIKRIYCNFLLLRDENKRVIPTNTAPHLQIAANDLESVADTIITKRGKQEVKKTKFIIKEHSIVKCNYVRDIANYNTLKMDQDLIVDNFEEYFDKENNERYSQDYIKYILDNNYFQNIIDKKTETYEIALDNLKSIYDIMKLFEVDVDELVYTIPYMISIETEPFLKATYYNMDINTETQLSYKYLNNKIGASFNIDTLSIEKDINPNASNKYNLDSNVYKISFNLNTNLSYHDLKDKVVIKCIMSNPKNQQPYGHFFFKLKDVTDDNDNITSYSYRYEAELSTDYTFNNGMLNMYNCLYRNTNLSDNFRSKLFKYVPIDEDICFQIGILYYDKNLAASQTKEEKEEWCYPFPIGFIQNIEDPIDIINDYDNVKEFGTCESLTDQSQFYKDSDTWIGYKSLDSVLMLPVFEDNWDQERNTETGNYEFYNRQEFLWDYDYPVSDRHPNGGKVYLNSIGSVNYFINEYSLSNGKLTVVIKDTYTSEEHLDVESAHLKLDGYIKIIIPEINLSGDVYNVEIGHKINYDEANSNNFGNYNDNIVITKKFDKKGNKFIYITIQDIANIGNDINTSYAKLITEDYPNNDSTDVDNKIFRRDHELVDLKGQLGLTIINNLYKMNRIAVVFYNVVRHIQQGAINKDDPINIKKLSLDSIILQRTDDDVIGGPDSRDNINNYALATVLNNAIPVKMYQNMSSIMNSIVTYDKDTDSYDIELVPLISLRYYMARPKMIYDLLNQFISIVDSLLPRLENNTNCDMKFYNTYGPSRYFYFNKETINKVSYINSETNEEVDIDAVDYNPYINTVVTNSSYTKYNYLGRTDIVLDFTIYVRDSITNEKDEEIKKFISDYVENANDELVLPISNLIVQLQNNFSIIKYIKYNGVFSDILNNNDPSKNNDYQIIDNDFDFNKMDKDEIRVYVPEYLNVKKSVVKEKESEITYVDDIFDILKYSTYDYVINITYKM